MYHKFHYLLQKTSPWQNFSNLTQRPSMDAGVKHLDVCIYLIITI